MSILLVWIHFQLTKFYLWCCKKKLRVYCGQFGCHKDVSEILCKQLNWNKRAIFSVIINEFDTSIAAEKKNETYRYPAKVFFTYKWFYCYNMLMALFLFNFRCAVIWHRGRQSWHQIAISKWFHQLIIMLS